MYSNVGMLRPPRASGPGRLRRRMTPNDTGITPRKDQVLVRRDPAETMHRARLHLPQGSEDWPQKGTVLATGPLVNEPGVVPGARVLFQPRPGTALVPDRREPDQPKEWERVVVLRIGGARVAPEAKRGPSDNYTGPGDILGIIEEE